MRHAKIALSVLIGALLISPAVPIQAADQTAAREVEQLDVAKVDRAKALLERAVARYRQKGDKAFAEFDGDRFRDGELYIYVLDLNGKFLASGGSSSMLVGRNVIDMKDSAGKPFFREMIQGAKEHGSGHIEYRWLNRLENREERKLTFYRRVGNRILAAGFYIPHATENQARALLDDAVAAFKKDKKQAMAEFGDLNGPFIRDDLYVFVVGLDDLRMKAHGGMPHLVGTDGHKLADANGRSIIVEMRQKLQNADQGELEYTWRNPLSHRVEPKRTFFRKVDNYMVAVGYYPAADRTPTKR